MESLKSQVPLGRVNLATESQWQSEEASQNTIFKCLKWKYKITKEPNYIEIWS